VNPKALEYEVTIDDAKAYKKPWTRKITQDLLPPGFQIFGRGPLRGTFADGDALLREVQVIAGFSGFFRW